MKIRGFLMALFLAPALAAGPLQVDDLTPEEFYDRAGIWAEFGKIICISVGYFTIRNAERQFRTKSIIGEEKQLLEEFNDLVKTHFSNPAFVRSLSIERSNSANEPTICIIIRPAAVVVSIASVIERNPHPLASIFSIMVSKSFNDRDSRSNFQTTTISPDRRLSIR